MPKSVWKGQSVALGSQSLRHESHALCGRIGDTGAVRQNLDRKQRDLTLELRNLAFQRRNSRRCCAVAFFVASTWLDFSTGKPEISSRNTVPMSACCPELSEPSALYQPYEHPDIHRSEMIAGWVRCSTAKSANTNLLGHTPHETDRPLRRETGRSVRARQLALSARSSLLLLSHNSLDSRRSIWAFSRTQWCASPYDAAVKICFPRNIGRN